MFSIFKKKHSRTVDLSGMGTDMHSHLLPGIDDGSPDTETSAILIKGLQDLGIQRFITTPHIFWDLYKNTNESIDGALEKLRLSYNGRFELPFRAAAEYYLDDHFDDLLRKDMPLRTIRNNWVLVEFSFVTPPIDLKEKIFAMQIKGYQPVLAHPERYAYLTASKRTYDELKDAGCLFQVNLLSLTPYYGKAANELANYLLKKNYVNLLGTDLHHERHLHTLRNSPRLTDSVKQLLDSGRLLNPTINI